MPSFTPSLTCFLFFSFLFISFFRIKLLMSHLMVDLKRASANKKFHE